MAFAFCVTAITTTPIIPNRVSNILAGFTRCSNLKTIQNIPSSIANANNAFGNCPLLESCTIYSTSNIAQSYNMFWNCTKLKTFYTTDIERLKSFLTDTNSQKNTEFPNDIDECTFIQIE